MHFADLLSQHLDDFKCEFHSQLTAEHYQAINAMLSCKTFNRGRSQWQCDDCHQFQDLPLSCGHRNCNLCQHNTTQDWLNRQQLKLLPVDYYTRDHSRCDFFKQRLAIFCNEIIIAT